MIPSSRPSLSSFGAPLPGLVEALLEEQRSLTAVERFSALQDAGGAPAKGLYSDLLPLREPGPGEQYAFEVDLDRCSGCKACVTACHSLNGLDEDETWRTVGLLQKTGRGATATIHQHVTTACHHCLEPGCAQGCPTLAYEKDPATGVVRHLDDQCFGCQYCTLKCPFDVPQYNAAKGIVRKCDLCIGRLRAGEAPACAQACPTTAIRVTLVVADEVRRAPEAAFALPGAPDPSRVQPTTRYVSARGLAKDLSSADAAQARPEHAHLPLVFMLVASQAAAGYWILHTLLSVFFPSAFLSPAFPPSLPLPELLGFLAVQGALALSLLHLGRPWLAWKAVLGWRRSWLSREVIAFSALAATTTFVSALVAAEWIRGLSSPALLRRAAFAAVALSAVTALHASAMVYRDTPRALWATRATTGRFALTAMVAGIPAWLLVATLSGLAPSSGWIAALCFLVVAAQLAKLALEASLLRHLDDGDFGALWKGAKLLFGPLQSVWRLRVFLGLAGGVLFPLLAATNSLSAPVAVPLTATLALTLAGELLERFLFFTTAVAPRMPGGRK